jgi:hypothetical protein
LYQYLEVDTDQLLWDIDYAMPDYAWCYYDPYGDTEAEMLLFDWKAFKEFVLHKARYTFFFLQRET